MDDKVHVYRQIYFDPSRPPSAYILKYWSSPCIELQAALCNGRQPYSSLWQRRKRRHRAGRRGRTPPRRWLECGGRRNRRGGAQNAKSFFSVEE